MTTEVRILPAAGRYPGFNWRRVALAFAITLGALLTLITFVACSYGAANEGRVMPGVTINGVSITGLDRAEAEARLRESLPDVSSGVLTVQIGSVEQTIAYADVQRDYDLTAILDEAMAYGHDGNPVEQFTDQLQTMFGATAIELTPAITYNADELARRVEAIVAAAQAQPVNATISYENGEYVLTPATSGRAVDGAAVLAQAVAVISGGDPASVTISVDTQDIPADIDTPAAQAAIAQAQAATSAPLVLSVGGGTFTVDTATLHEWVELEQTAPGQWTLTVDDAAVTEYVAGLKAQVDQPAVDASFEFNEVGESVVTSPSETGQELDSAGATQMIVTALDDRGQGSSAGSLALPVAVVQPELTTAEAQAAISDVRLLGTWTTRYIPSPLNGQGVNIRRPAQLINGTVIKPGQLFNFVGIAGPFTVANGYTEGAAIVRGKTKAEGVLGGGLCSASTTMFNAALRAGFRLGARSNHAYYISRYPVGLDATIWISGSSVRNMTFTNDSKYPIVVRAINKRRSVTFQIWGVADGRRVNLSDPVVTNQRAAGEYYRFTDTLPPRETKRVEYKSDGFNSVVVRTVRDKNGRIIWQNTIRSSYRKTDGIVLLGRYPGDPVAGTLIPYGPLPPNPGPGPSPTPGGTEPPATEAPTANFSVSPVDSDTRKFINSSTGGTHFVWDFGDGKTKVKDTKTSPSHTYT
ncbi:MAG TPA: VanW family protein, partial [Candidatus Limnocylindrales bacterium]|nr:VanW family protein [Candidatus Limnocylindrales bacterium]